MMVICAYVSVRRITQCLVHDVLNSATTISSKNTPPLFAHYLEAKVGVERLLDYLISLVHTPPRFLTMLRSRSILTTTGLTFRKNSQQLC